MEVSRIVKGLFLVLICNFSLGWGSAWAGILEVGSVSLHSTLTSATFTTQNFSAPFTTTPLVFILPSQQGSDPSAIRLRNISTTGFSAAQVEPSSEDGPHVAMTVYYLAIEPGTYQLPDGRHLQAAFIDTTTFQHATGGGYVTFPFPSGFFTNPPAMITDLQGMANETGTPPGAPSVPWMTAHTNSVTTAGFDATIERSETSSGVLASNERIGWLAVEPGNGTFAANDLGGAAISVAYDFLNTTGIRGWDNGCFTTNYNQTFTSNPLVFANLRSRNEADGGWLRRCSESTTALGLRVDEDQVADGERSHIAEDASILAFSQAFRVDLAALTQAVVENFNVASESDHLLLSWETASEVGTLGFVVERKNEKSGKFKAIGRVLAAADLKTPQGKHYYFQDNESLATKVVSYRLKELSLNGQNGLFGPWSVKPQPLSQEKRQSMQQQLSAGAAVRVSPRKPAAIAASSAAAITGAPVVRAVVSVTGIQRLDSGSIASAFSVSESEIVQRISEGGISLRLNGAEIAWHSEDAGQALVFYAVTSDSIYHRENHYLLSLSAGLRMAEQQVENTAPTPVAVDSIAVRDKFEQDVFAATVVSRNPNEDYWYWKALIGGDASLEQTSLDFVLDDVLSAEASLTVRLRGATPEHHHAMLMLNGEPLGEADWMGDNGVHSAVFSIAAGLIQSGSNTLTIKAMDDMAQDMSVLYIDGFDVEYTRAAVAVNGALERSSSSVAGSTSAGFSGSQINVLEISNSSAPKWLSGVNAYALGGGYAVAFKANAVNKLIMAEDSALFVPSLYADQQQDLRDTGNRGRYLIVAPASLLDGAQLFASFREGSVGPAKVVTLQSVYDEFSYGQPTPVALKAFFSYAKQYWVVPPQFVLLLGNASFDYRNLMAKNDNLLPSLMVTTANGGLFSSDTALVDFDGDAVPDLAIGRIPVMNNQQIGEYLAKLSRFESTGLSALSDVILSDNEDQGGHFYAQGNELSMAYGLSHLSLQTASLETLRAALFPQLPTTRILNYTGHSGLDRVASEGIITLPDLVSDVLGNSDYQGVMTAATCVLNRFAVPGYDSLGEELVTDSNEGFVAVWAPSGLSQGNSAHELNRLLMKRVASTQNTQLGELLKGVLGSYAYYFKNRDLVRVYNLMGDPAISITGQAAVLNGTPLSAIPGVVSDGASCHIRGNVTWRKSLSPIRLDCDLIVDELAALTIEQGVEIKTALGRRIIARGVISINGTDAEPVLVHPGTIDGSVVGFSQELGGSIAINNLNVSESL